MTVDAFWNATRDHRLLLQWCTRGDHPVWYPRNVCPVHLTPDLDWRPAAGTGVVYAYTVDHRADPPLATALVELDEGVRMMTNIVDCPWSSVRVGLPVRVAWQPMEDGRNLPQFTPREGT